MTPPATQCLPSVSVAIAGMAGCFIPLSSAATNIVGLCPSSVDCCISSPLRLIATSLLCRNPSRCLSTPSPSSVAVTPSGRRYCIIRGWHFESRLLRFSTCPILPLVDCSVSPLGTLSGIHLPTNRVANTVPAGIEDQCNLRWPGVGGQSLPSRSPSLAICLIVGSSLLSTSSPNVVGIDTTLDLVGHQRVAPCRCPTTRQRRWSRQERCHHDSRVIKQ